VTVSQCARANARRNADAVWWRWWRWRGARDELWQVLDRHVRPDAAVAVVGAGAAHDVPLHRLARRSRRVDLIDVDGLALRRGRRRLTARRGRVSTEVLDVTFGAADAAIGHACGNRNGSEAIGPRPLSRAPYDGIVADLLYTQLLYPALLDAGLSGLAIDAALRRDGQPVTNAVVSSLHASAPSGTVVHLHDLVGWWRGHDQPFSPEEILELARSDPERALAVAEQGHRPLGCDIRRAISAAGAQIIDTAMWLWPFAPGVDYLVCATVATCP
jgi:hypothetical protein